MKGSNMHLVIGWENNSKLSAALAGGPRRGGAEAPWPKKKRRKEMGETGDQGKLKTNKQTKT